MPLLTELRMVCRTRSYKDAAPLGLDS